MERSQRIELLKQIQKKAPFAQGYPLLYRGERKSFDVWEIPMECLIYNQYNGRIGSVVKSYEKQNHKLNPELTDDAALIEKFLWQSKADKNEKTMGSLRQVGQLKFGIVTSDGVIVDGNRRVSLMNRILSDARATQEEKNRCKFFRAVILPENATKKEKYEALLPQMEALTVYETDLVANLANISSALHQVFSWWWVGFYWVKENDLVLAPFQGPIACTRIAFGKGVCGTAWKERKTQLVPDVEQFPGHIACSSATKSEIVVPIFNQNDEVMGVLDVDSERDDVLDETDVFYLEKISKMITKIHG